jgi:hypothetical protein
MDEQTATATPEGEAARAEKWAIMTDASHPLHAAHQRGDDAAVQTHLAPFYQKMSGPVPVVIDAGVFSRAADGKQSAPASVFSVVDDRVDNGDGLAVTTSQVEHADREALTLDDHQQIQDLVAEWGEEAPVMRNNAHFGLTELQQQLGLRADALGEAFLKALEDYPPEVRKLIGESKLYIKILANYGKGLRAE